MRRACLVVGWLGLASGCLGSLGGDGDAIERGDARDFGLHATERPTDARLAARLALAQDAHRREARFVDAVDPGHTWAASRPSQLELDAGLYDNEELFGIGGQIFETTFTPEMGYGGADLPILATVHTGLRGGPDARRCDDCHHLGGLAGAGTAIDNAFVRGDGLRVSSAIVRNPPSLAGAGLVELVASQLSSDLQRRRDEARRLAEDDDTEIRIALGARGIDYGHLTVRPDGSIDTSELVGIDDDLRVRPFGRKGRWATLREVIEDELLVHHGMLTDNLAATAVTDRVGSFGRSDPDGDSVTDEISEGQLTALTFFVAMQDVPQLVPPADGEVLSQWARGQADFVDLGCAECHVPRVRLDDAEYRVPSRRANVTRRTFLDTQGAEPRIEPAVDDDQLWVWLYSDLRRHDMGPGLAELRAEGSIPGSVFVTPALWGVAVTPPYLHDGRAPTLAEAIALHGGEAAASAAAWAERDDEGRAPLLVFLTSLRRAPRLVAR